MPKHPTTSEASLSSNQVDLNGERKPAVIRDAYALSIANTDAREGLSHNKVRAYENEEKLRDLFEQFLRSQREQSQHQDGFNFTRDSTVMAGNHDFNVRFNATANHDPSTPTHSAVAQSHDFPPNTALEEDGDKKFPPKRFWPKKRKLPKVKEELSSSMEYDEEALSWRALCKKQGPAGVGEKSSSLKRDSNVTIETIEATAVEPNVEPDAELAISTAIYAPNHPNDEIPTTIDAIATEEDDDRYYPKDSYSILVLNGPTENNWSGRKFLFCLFAFVPFVFQTGFLHLMQLHLAEKRDEGQFPHLPTDTDEMDADAIAKMQACIRNVRVAQGISLLAYVVFPNSTLNDIIKAIQLFPMSAASADKDVPVACIRISCILRGVQGLFALLIVFLLVMSSHNTLDIILNFTAVNFITDLDDTAFSLAKSGVFGKHLKREAYRIANTKLPACINRESKQVWCGIVMVSTAVILYGLMTFILLAEDTAFHWIIAALNAQKIVVAVFLLIYITRLIMSYYFRRCCRRN